MMRYAVIDNGVVVNVVEADEALDATWLASASANVGDTFDGESFTPAPPTEPPPSWLLSHLAFKRRFPRAKWIAAKQARAADADLDDFFDSYERSKHIDLQDSETILGVSSLMDPGVPAEFRLSQAEVDAVLTVPAGPEEAP